MPQDRTPRFPSLAEVPAGKQVRLHRVNAGEGLQGRLNAMGMVTGECITIERNGSRGPLLLRVKGARVVLGREACRKIDVSVLDE